ncbi:MAG: polysaccharide biosynthesis tyrosine autokinase [Thermosynechococcaceae cyanobacterium]
MEISRALPANFSDYQKLFKYHWIPGGAVFLSVLTLSIAAAFLQKPTYVSESKLKLNRENPISSLTEVGKTIGQMGSVTETSNPVLTEVQVIQSQPMIEKTLQQLNWTLPDGKPLDVDTFKEHLTVADVKDADILQIEFKDKDPQKAAEAVNTLMNVYLQGGIQSNRGEVGNTRTFIAERLPKAKAQVEVAENQLRQFKQTHQILTLKDQVVAAQARIDGLQKQIADAQAQLANAAAQERAVTAKLGISSQQAIALSSLSQSPEIQDLLPKIQQVQAQLLVERNRFTDSHPSVMALEGNLADLKQLFAQKAAKITGSSSAVFDPDTLIGKLQQDLTADLVRLDTSQKGLKQEIAAQTESLNTYREQVATLPKLEQQQNDLARQLEVAQSSYNSLLQKFQETQVAGHQKQGNARIIAAATVPEKPTSPRKPLYIATGLILGSVLAFLTMYGLETLNKSLRTVEEVRRQMNLPILGVIPFFGRRPLKYFGDGANGLPPRLYLTDYPDHKVSEAYRLLRSNLQSLDGGRGCKVVAITSTLPQEGTSTVAANLALALAQNGQSTLLMEANYQDPIQEYIWSWPVQLGLSDILVRQKPWRSIVERIHPNLDLILSGTQDGEAISSLDSRQMASLLNDVSKHYDFVILDTASLESGANTVRLAQLVDGIVLVAQPGQIDAENAAFAQQVLSQVPKPILGLVLNQVQPIHEPYPYYYISSAQNAAASSTLDTTDGSANGLGLTAVDPADPDPDPLAHMPLDQLQNKVEQLQKDWLKSARLVREQEEELSLQSQTVREMHEKLQSAREYHRHAANEYERLSLEVQLVDEEERKRLLDETLVGQRRRLVQQQTVLQHHAQILKQRLQSPMLRQ